MGSRRREVERETVTRSAVPSIRLAIDIALFGLILLMLSPRLTGLPVHEWLGLALGVPVVVHLLLSWSWIARATLVVPVRPGWRHRANYILNWFLFGSLVLEIVSGIMISAVAIPALGAATVEDRAWRNLHNRYLNLFALLVAIHIAMNWSALRSGLRRWLARETA
jgi:cytochrome b